MSLRRSTQHIRHVTGTIIAFHQPEYCRGLRYISTKATKWDATSPIAYWTSNGLSNTKRRLGTSRSKSWLSFTSIPFMGLAAAISAVATGTWVFQPIAIKNEQASGDVEHQSSISEEVASQETLDAVVPAIPEKGEDEVVASLIDNPPPSPNTEVLETDTASLAEVNVIPTEEMAEEIKEEPTLRERLESVLDELLPLVDRARTALTSDYPNTSQEKVDIGHSRDELPGELRKHSKLFSGQVIHTKGLLGLEDDISAVTLLQYNPSATTDDGATYGAATRQAVADTEVIASVLKEVEEHHKEEYSKAVDELQVWEKKAHTEIERASAAIEQGCKSLALQEKTATKSKDTALELQELSMTVKFETKANQERLKRSQSIDNVRLDVNAVDLAHSHLQDKIEVIAQKNKKSASILKLCDALESNDISSAQGWASELRSNEDAVVSTVAESVLSPSVAELNSIRELQQKWPSVKRNMRAKKSLVHSEGAGFFSTCLTMLSASLKVSEEAALSSRPWNATFESKLAFADIAFREGDIPKVIQVLEDTKKEIPSDALVNNYLASMKLRALVDQTVAVLQAHLAASAS